MTALPHSNTDALLVLVQRISDTQTQQGLQQLKQNEDQHAIRLTLATLNARLEPLANLIPDLTALRLASQHNILQLEQHDGEIEVLRAAVDQLKTAAAARSGWETFGGKILYLVGGAVIAGLIATATVVKTAHAGEEMADLRLDNAANYKCWGAAAPRTPKAIYL